MNIDITKKYISSLKKCKVKVRTYLGRNKYEHFIGIIENTYNNIFTIRTNNIIKSFSYTDVIIKNVILEHIK